MNDGESGGAEPQRQWVKRPQPQCPPPPCGEGSGVGVGPIEHSNRLGLGSHEKPSE